MNATNETSNSSRGSNMKLQQQHKLQTTQLTQTTDRRIAQKLLQCLAPIFRAALSPASEIFWIFPYR